MEERKGVNTKIFAEIFVLKIKLKNGEFSDQLVEKYLSMSGFDCVPKFTIISKKALSSNKLISFHIHHMNFRGKGLILLIVSLAHLLLSVSISRNNSSVKNNLKYSISE